MTAQVFFVGGAVRDVLMGVVPKDLDFVVVGSNPAEMEALGFERVGADFPVFLHPITKDEFALARTERKVGTGHTGFECDWEGVTLEEDLKRRDLTINAMALPVVGTLEEISKFVDLSCDALACPDAELNDWMMELLVDPFGGFDDLKSRTLRHVSTHFGEDPLRVLRLARFLARFGSGWSTSLETVAMCHELARSGELESLTAERVWKEVSRALMEKAPQRFFLFMAHLSAPSGWRFLPELTDLMEVEQRPDHHPEGDAFVHTLLCLEAAAKMGCDLPTMFAVLCHDFGKKPAFVENTAKGQTHLGGHESMGVPLVEAVCDRWKVPTECRKLAVLVTRDHQKVHTLKDLKPSTAARMLSGWGLLQEGNEKTVERVLKACAADARGRGAEHANRTHPSEHLLPRMAAEFTRKVDVRELFQGKPMPKEGKKVGEAVERERLRRLTQLKKEMVG